jgi:DNA polymerase-3 subunit alpha
LCIIGTHNHDDTSNIRLLDSTNRIGDLLKTAVDLNYKGLAITNHECLSSHVKAIQTVREMKKKGKMPDDFKLILGNEIYQELQNFLILSYLQKMKLVMSN